jgi:hypothetical protein
MDPDPETKEYKRLNTDLASDHWFEADFISNRFTVRIYKLEAYTVQMKTK